MTYQTNLHPHDLAKMTSRELLALWEGLPAPDFQEMNGEYLARPLANDAPYWRFLIASLFTIPYGNWLGKAFYPTQDNRGHGYNSTFRNNDGQKRWLTMETYVGASNVDESNSFFVDYSKGRKPGLSMESRGRDEIRKLSEDLYLGFGTVLTLSGQAKQHWWFCLEGPAHPFDQSMIGK